MLLGLYDMSDITLSNHGGTLVEVWRYKDQTAEAFQHLWWHWKPLTMLGPYTSRAHLDSCRQRGADNVWKIIFTKLKVNWMFWMPKHGLSCCSWNNTADCFRHAFLCSKRMWQSWRTFSRTRGLSLRTKNASRQEMCFLEEVTGTFVIFPDNLTLNWKGLEFIFRKSYCKKNKSQPYILLRIIIASSSHGILSDVSSEKFLLKWPL